MSPRKLLQTVASRAILGDFGTSGAGGETTKLSVGQPNAKSTTPMIAAGSAPL